MKTDVVIVGGGISGLYTALKCLHYGMRITLLEKMERLGGRVHSIYQDPYTFEAGAGRFHENHRLVRQLIAYFGLHESKLQTQHVYQTDPSFHEATSIMQVLEYVKTRQIPAEVLQQIPFIRLCQTVLGRPLAQKVLNAFGYNAEFELMNSYDALRMFERDFAANAKYYYCKEGLSALIEHMVWTIAYLKGRVFTQTEVTDVKRTREGFKISAKDGAGKLRVYFCSAVVCAIPKANLEELKFFSQDQRNLMNTVVPVSLHRIYGTFPVANGKPWFSGIPRSTTHTKIRQFVPVDKKTGLAMVSYSDTSNADFWKRYADQGTNALKKQLLKQLHVTFPDVDSIPEPKWLNSYYWQAGVHMWKPGVDSQSIIPQVQQILGTHSAFYIVGEAYAKNQAWMEGALESVEAIFKSLASHIDNIYAANGGDNARFAEYIISKNHLLAKSELAKLKKMYPDVLWVTIRDPKDGILRLVDVTEWVRMHPGGDVFTLRKHQDITHEFFRVPYHRDIDGNIKSSVIDKIRKYTVAVIQGA